MSTQFDVLDRLYPQINVATVNTLINGNVYRYKKPLNSEKQDIVIVPLFLRDGEEMVAQPGTFFINMYAQNFDNGEVDGAKLNAISDAVVNQVTSFRQGVTYMHLEIESESLYQDEDQDNMSYASLRLLVVTE